MTGARIFSEFHEPTCPSPGEKKAHEIHNTQTKGWEPYALIFQRAFISLARPKVLARTLPYAGLSSHADIERVATHLREMYSTSCRVFDENRVRMLVHWPRRMPTIQNELWKCHIVWYVRERSRGRDKLGDPVAHNMHAVRG